jgi:peptidoglycan/LPS O-acetylase OafA/YrhL
MGHFLKRIATFIALIGILLIMLFLYSDSVNTPRLSYLFYGVILLAFSFLMGIIGPRSSRPPSEPKHFRLLKGRRKEQKIDRAKERKED